MSTVAIHQSRQRLDNLFLKVASIGADIELQSHWARYLCVLVAGFIETSVRSLLSGYVRKNGSPSVASYVETQLRFFQNPKMERILDLARSFNPDWADRVETATEGELKDSVDSVIANRNQIAHGENVGVTYVTMKRYYENAVKVIEIVERKCQ